MFGWNATDGWWFDANPIEWATLVAVAAGIGLWLRVRHLKRRRRASLTREGDGTYVWIEIDGTPGRSRDDPRDGWDAKDSSGDGDGDGGGGD